MVIVIESLRLGVFKNLYPLFMPNNFTAFIITKHVIHFQVLFPAFVPVLKLLFVPLVLISRKTSFCTRALFTYARQIVHLATKRCVPHWPEVHFYRGRQAAMIRSSLQLPATPMIPSCRAKRSYAHHPRDSGGR